MNVRRAWLVTAIGGLALSGGVLAHLWRLGKFSDGPGGPAIRAILDYPMATLDARSETLNRFAGKVLVINYWATWCAPCREEIPLFVKLQDEWGGKGLQFVGIAIDQVAKVAQFAKEFNINYPLYVGAIQTMDLSRAAGNKAGVLPYTLILRRDGSLATHLTGKVTETRLRDMIAPLL